MTLRPLIRLMAWCTAACLVAAGPLFGQAVSQDAVITAFQNIRNDDVPQNAQTACAWIQAHRDDITPQLVDELYRTDRQGRDVILYALMRTKGYTPDARFCQTLVSRLNEEDRFVGNGDLGLRDGVHWYAWTYMDRRYDLFKADLLANLQTTTDMLTIWGTVVLLQKHGGLAAEEPRFSPSVWSTAAASLKADKIDGNAGQAVRFYLTIGTDALPYLKPLETSDDPQTRSLATATVDAMGGSKRAYGYLAVNVSVARTLFQHRGEVWPDWLVNEADQWQKLGNGVPYQSQ